MEQIEYIPSGSDIEAQHSLSESVEEEEVGIHFLKNQKEIFYKHDAKFKIVAKGRRFGFTRGLAQYVILRAIEQSESILWVDTTYTNIVRYIERYFLPVLKGLHKEDWSWLKTRSEMKIMNGANNTVIDFRSADRPENIEGFGYSLIVLNEAGIILKNERLWLESIRPMMLDYQADAIIGGTPKGKRAKGKEHLFYTLYKKDPLCVSPLNKGENKEWKSFNYSTYDNEMIEAADIEELESELPQSLIRQEIYGEFIEEEESEIIKKKWWVYHEPAEWQKEKVFGIYQSWDTAFKKNEENDYSVCTTWVETKNMFWLINCVRERLEFPELKVKVVDQYNKFKPRQVFIEDKASGQSLVQEIQRETRIPVKAIKINGDKVARANAVTPLFEAGKVTIELSYWSDQVMNECAAFPSGEFDDVVDSITLFLNERKGSNQEIGKTIHRKRIKVRRY